MLIWWKRTIVWSKESIRLFNSFLPKSSHFGNNGAEDDYKNFLSSYLLGRKVIFSFSFAFDLWIKTWELKKLSSHWKRVPFNLSCSWQNLCSNYRFSQNYIYSLNTFLYFLVPEYRTFRSIVRKTGIKNCKLSYFVVV